MSPVDDLNLFHKYQVEEFENYIDRVKALEAEMKLSLDRQRILESKLEERLKKAKEAHDGALNDKSQSERAFRQAENSREIAEASKKSHEEATQRILEKEKKINKEGKSIENQREDLNNSIKEISRREKFLEIEEMRLNRLRIKVEKIIEQHKLQELVG